MSTLDHLLKYVRTGTSEGACDTANKRGGTTTSVDLQMG